METDERTDTTDRIMHTFFANAVGNQGAIRGYDDVGVTSSQVRISSTATLVLVLVLSVIKPSTLAASIIGQRDVPQTSVVHRVEEIHIPCAVYLAGRRVRNDVYRFSTPWVKKKQDTKLLAITSPIIIDFQNFFTTRLCSKFSTNRV